MKTAVSNLTLIGLTDYEAKAYIALLKENPLTAYEIAKISGIPSSKVYEVVKKLESRQMVQSIHGERARMFIPVSPDEFIDSFKTAMDNNLNAVKAELKDYKSGIETSYTWNIKDYEGLLFKAKRILETSQKTALVSIWPQEIEALSESIIHAEKRGVKIAIVHYGTTNFRYGQVYRHPVEDTIYSLENSRGLTIVADSKEVLTCSIEKKEIEAVWSMNKALVIMAEDYIKHDIYVMKIVGRFDPLLKEKFGARYENLRDVYKNLEVEQ